MTHVTSLWRKECGRKSLPRTKSYSKGFRRIRCRWTFTIQTPDDERWRKLGDKVLTGSPDFANIGDALMLSWADDCQLSVSLRRRNGFQPFPLDPIKRIPIGGSDYVIRIFSEAPLIEGPEVSDAERARENKRYRV